MTMPPNSPPHRPPPRWASPEEWVHFFIGTPRRVITTAICGVIVFGLIRPDIVNALVARANDMLLGPILYIAIVLIGMRLLYKAIFPSKKKSGH